MTLPAWLRSLNVFRRLRYIERENMVMEQGYSRVWKQIEELRSGRTTHDRRLALLEKRRKTTKKGGRK